MLSKRIDDQKLKRLISIIGPCNLETGPWIAGGCARKLWFGEPWDTGDIDLFFPSVESFKRTCDILENIVNESIVSDHVLDGPYSLKPKQSTSPVHRTENAITYKIQIGRIFPDLVDVQAIRKQWHASLKDVFDSFDFTACRFATDGKLIVADEVSVNDSANKMLRLTDGSRSATPKRVGARRVIKYGIYGFCADREIMEELLSQHRRGTILAASGDDYD